MATVYPCCRVISIQHGSRICAGWRLTPYPAYDPGTLSLSYSLFLLKLPGWRPQNR
ncbi:hypothetical protein KVR801_90196 [Klebsiella variicola]|nr:hypothetical protein KVR801_90196 [Klebsiella variicola]